MGRVDRQLFTRCRIVLELEHLQASCPDRVGNQMLGVPTPSEADKKEIQTTPQVDEAPQLCARQLVANALVCRLHMGSKVEVRTARHIQRSRSSCKCRMSRSCDSSRRSSSAGSATVDALFFRSWDARRLPGRGTCTACCTDSRKARMGGRRYESLDPSEGLSRCAGRVPAWRATGHVPSSNGAAGSARRNVDPLAPVSCNITSPPWRTAISRDR